MFSLPCLIIRAFKLGSLDWFLAKISNVIAKVHIKRPHTGNASRFKILQKVTVLNINTE